MASRGFSTPQCAFQGKPETGFLKDDGYIDKVKRYGVPQNVMQTIHSTPTIQNNSFTRQLSGELLDAAKKLSMPSKGGETFKEIMTGIEKLSGTREKIEQLENAYSKYDALFLELNKPILLQGFSFKQEEQVNIEKNVEEIKNAIQASISALNSQKPRNTSVVQSSYPVASPTHQPRANNHVLDANGIQYKRLTEGGGGYCGDMAVAQVTNTRYDPSASRKRLGEIRSAQIVFAHKVQESNGSIGYYTPQTRFNALKTLIPDFSTCKNYALSYIQSQLQAEGVQNKETLEHKAKLFNESQSYDDLWRNYCKTVERPQTNQLAFNGFFVTSLPTGLQIRSDLNAPNNFLIEGELQALMLDQGYVFSHNILPEDGTHAVKGAYTVLVFEHLSGGTARHIACNSRPLSQNRMGLQSEGSHYIPLVPVKV